MEGGEWKSPIVKFFSERKRKRLRSKLEVEEGDLILFAADKWEIVCEVLGRVRSRIAEMQELTEGSDAAQLPLGRRLPAPGFHARGQ